MTTTATTSAKVKVRETFEDCLSAPNAHPTLFAHQTWPATLREWRNVAFFGPPGVGKYTQALRVLQRYSDNGLKTCTKMTITTTVNKAERVHTLRTSDIHYEVDVSMLGCNAKVLWHQIFQHIAEAVSAKASRVGVVLCRNFHGIHSELLETFYSYMQQPFASAVSIKFCLLTEHLGFLPTPIVDCCHVVHVPRPTKNVYLRATHLTRAQWRPETDRSRLTNFKLVRAWHADPVGTYPALVPAAALTDRLIRMLTSVRRLSFAALRDTLYDLLIHGLDVVEVAWDVVRHVLRHDWLLPPATPSDLLNRAYSFLRLFHNNYRPIYHLEHFYLWVAVHVRQDDDDDHHTTATTSANAKDNAEDNANDNDTNVTDSATPTVGGKRPADPAPVTGRATRRKGPR